VPSEHRTHTVFEFYSAVVVHICGYFIPLPVSPVLSHWFSLAAACTNIYCRRPGRLKLSNSVLVLHYGSGPFSDFLVKILGPVTPLSLLLLLVHVVWVRGWL
jgi:hypothetical protein